MRLVMVVLAALSIALATPSAQSDSAAGHYVLEGMMEVGSELLLKPDGQFEFMLAYGAADYWARGSWRAERDAVILNSAGKQEEPFRFLRSEPGTA